MPPIGAGFQSFIGMADESVYGTPVAPTNWLRMVSTDWGLKATQTVGNRGLGRLFRSCIRNRLKRSGGSIAFDFGYEGFERMFRQFLGGYSHAVVGTTGHLHTFTPSTTRQVGMTLQVHQGINRMQYPGCKLTGMNLSYTNEVLSGSFSGVGQVGATGSVGVPTFSTAPCIMPLQEVSAGLSITVGGSPINITSMDVQMALPHTEGREYLGSDLMKEPVISDVLAVTGTIQREHEDTSTFISPWLADTAAAVVVTIEDDTTIAGSSPATKYKLVLTLNEVIWGEVNLPVDGPGPIIESIPFIARADSSGNLLSLALTNGAATL